MASPNGAITRVFDPKITLGNIIQIAIIVLGFFVAWGTLSTRVTVVEKAYVDQGNTIGSINIKMDTLTDKVSTIAVNQAANAQQLKDIAASQREAANRGRP